MDSEQIQEKNEHLLLDKEILSHGHFKITKTINISKMGKV
jgi:hypothetical protein